MGKFKKTALSVISVGMAVCFSTSIAAMAVADSRKGNDNASAVKADAISRLDASIDTHTADYFDSKVAYRLSENVKSNQEISVILSLNGKSTFDAYLEGGSKGEFSDYLETAAGKNLAKKNRLACDELARTLDRAQVSYKMGVGYDALISGFEVVIRARDYDKLVNAVGNKAELIVSEVYAPAETEIVTNEVEVYETGIFDSSNIEHQGDGVIVAVLDTGLDYTHTAFSVNNFTTSNEAFTLSTIAEKLANNQLSAATTTANLKAEDVYISKKVPYAYDYADKDADVFPLDSEHGTHVAGIIAGKDSEITGVAPNAQLAIMKVFSDSTSGAKTSWLIAALDDCVKLGVDVINMSLGSPAGFTTQDDEARVENIYNKVLDAGISLITAAGNDYVATMGSEKNGNNPATHNPDSGIVGSPSTYNGALSVASVGGVKTPYFMYNGDIMYFTEASTSSAKTKNFVDDILKTVGGKDSYDFTYVTIPGVGRRSDYAEEKSFYQNKIVLVKRGDTTFEEKVDVAIRIMGASGIIIYNNVSGSISMSVGADVGAVCSIAQDEGEKLAAAGTGILRISKNQVAGPFMSDFSSWGPTSDLKIKPEITAHGGEIYSAVPGQSYDRLSGTSMACPNMAGAAALIRQYVKYGNSASGNVFGDLDEIAVTARVNQLAMSTADIVRNKNGLPYAVRKQGAGLVNISKATTTAAYISTFETVDGKSVEMDKSKLELGDDKNRTGVYSMTFAVNNLSKTAMTYNLSSVVMTEGVSTTYTSHGDTTVTQDGYLLSPTTEIIKGGSGTTITVPANGSTMVTVRITLSDADKAYMNESFKYGMYVEGFIMLDAVSGTSIDLSVPMLAFYGDWTEAPIFDEEYYDTNADELNQGIDAQDKLMPDAYATRIYGGTYSDYILTLGSYPFIQNPAATPVAANKEHIALSNYEDGNASAVNFINSISAGLLRNVKEWTISIVEDSTGKEIWSKTDRNQRKSVHSGSTIYGSTMDVDFSVLEHNLKNNTKYTVTVKTYIDYGTHEEQNNARNTFTFPLYIDFEAPIVTGVDYRTEYDQSTKKTRLYADVNIYDNHYAMAVSFGQIVESTTPGYLFSMNSFGKYLTPVFSSYNSTSKVTIELTDYLALIKESIGAKYDSDGNLTIVTNNNCFTATVYDYALNSATYELQVPDEVIAMYFDGEELQLNPNETLDLTSILHIFPADTWSQVLDFTSSNNQIVGVVNQTAIAKVTGMGQSATITATGKDANGNTKVARIKIYVRQPGDDGYRSYDPPSANKAKITQYETLNAFHGNSNEDREIGVTGGTYDFGNNYTLSMFPAESVKLISEVDNYFPEYELKMKYTSSRSDIVSIDENGVVLALAKGTATLNVSAEITYGFSGKTINFFIGTVTVTVKDPFTTMSIYLQSYRGLGGTVEIPGDRGITTIQTYAFSLYDIVEKDTSAGDVIDDDDPLKIKQMYLGNDTIKKVIIPEGVEVIEAYAFANLSVLEEVVLPSTLVRIGVGAFLNCTKLKKVNFEHVKFINERAFFGCSIEQVNFSSIVAIGSYAFYRNKIGQLVLPTTAQSLDSGAFYQNTSLNSVTFNASQIKLGSSVFFGCTTLKRINVNATVIPAFAFYGCTQLEDVTLGKDVSVIGEEAFGATNVASFKINLNNKNIETRDFSGKYVQDGNLIYNKQTGKLVMVAPRYSDTTLTIPKGTTSVASGALAGNASILHVVGDDVTTVEAYAFADCVNLQSVSFPKLTQIGDYAFYGCTQLIEVPDLANVTKIGDFAFSCNPMIYNGSIIGEMKITSVEIADNTVIGEGAFAFCFHLTSVTIGDNVKIGAMAFYSPVLAYNYAVTESLSHYTEYNYEVGDDANTVYSYYSYNFADGVLSELATLTLGDNVTIGANAFTNNANLTNVTVGDNAKAGAYAFYNAAGLKEIDLTKFVEIGEGAFSGSREPDLWVYKNYVRNAYEFTVIDGEAVPIGYKYTDFAPAFEEADVSNATSIGLGAFAFNQSLKSVTLNSELEEIAPYMFAECASLDTIKAGSASGLPTSVTSIGAYAFLNTALTSINLGNVSVINAYAFASTSLTTVTLKNGVSIGANAFYNCEALTTVNNMGGAKEIGAGAFLYTAITTADLTNAVSVGDFAFGQSEVTDVVFGDQLVDLGENPFFGCNIATFAKEEDIEFHGQVIGKQTVTTYDVSDSVKVINNALYTVVPNGLQLVCYPIGAKAAAFTVEEGTVRISARAMLGADIVTVTLPRTLKAIGDKAFFECERLTTVIFKSYYAPILEEEFDPYYVTSDNLPISGNLGSYEGLGISDYYMWNATSPNNFYFGANFVGNIGKFVPRLIMVSPANGQGYKTFIFEKYFSTFVLGSNAPTEETLRVISMIAALGDITLEKEAQVVAARRAYDALPSLEQQSLVENYAVLTSAERTIEYLKSRLPQPETPTPSEEQGDKINALGIAGFTLAGVMALVIVWLVLNTFLSKKKPVRVAKSSANDAFDSSETVTEETAAVSEDTSSEDKEEDVWSEEDSQENDSEEDSEKEDKEND